MQNDIKHGQARRQAKTTAYKCWTDIRKRCRSHPRYAGRGINLCDRWQEFENFYEDMGDPPPGMSIDRIDNNGHYEPGNCRWASRTDQCRNRATNINVTYRGRTMCLKAWAIELGMTYITLHYRIRQGWSVERVFETPIGKASLGPRKQVRYRGRSRFVAELAKEAGIPHGIVLSRLKSGCSVEHALNAPYVPRKSGKRLTAPVKKNKSPH